MMQCYVCVALTTRLTGTAGAASWHVLTYLRYLVLRGARLFHRTLADAVIVVCPILT